MASKLGTTTGADIANSLQSMSTPFKADSKALGASTKATKNLEKVAKEISSPLEDMSKFFSGIDKNIRDVATKIGEQTGITRLMASIMGKDLELSEKEALAARRKSAGSNIDKAKSKQQEEKGPMGEGILASLKEAFENLVPKQEIGELGKILLLATGALILVKIAQQFSGLLAPVLEFFFETLVPGLKELHETIMKSPTGYLGIGGVATLATLAITKYGANVRGFFTNIVKNLGKLRVDMGKEFSKFLGKGKIVEGFRKVLAPITRIGTFIAGLAKTVGSGAGTLLAKLPGVAMIGNFGKLFIRFLGPVGLIIQAFVGLFSGIKDAIAEFKESGSIMKAIGAFFGGVFDAIIGSTLNLLADLLGFIIKKLGFEKLGEFISNLDFTTEGIGKAISFVIEKIKFGFDLFVDGLKRMANFVIKGINLVLPKKYEIPLFETMSMEEMKARSEAEGIKGSEGTNIAEGLADKTDKENVLNADARAEGNAKRLEKVTGTTVTAIGDITTEKFDFKAEKAKVLKAEQEKLATQQSQTKALANINAINNSKGGDTYNQSSVHTSSEPASDHRDLTAKALASALYA